MKKITVSILTTLLMLSMVFSSSVFAANEEKASAWDSFLGLFSAKTAATSDVGVEYRGHVQNKGDFPLDGSWIQGPDQLGTVGESLRLEAFWIKLTNEVPAGLHIQYRVHVQNKGWMAPVEDGALAGTQGESLQIESVEIKLVDDAGNPAVGYSVEYRGHIQNKGDMPADGSWYKDGEQLGTVGEFLRLEALEVKIVQTKADMTAYNAAVAAAGALTEADYTADSWAALETALATVVTEDNTQAEVDAATAAINDAIDGLVMVTNVTGVSATDAKTLTVTFNQAISAADQAKVTFATKRGAVNVSLTPTWAADGKSASLTSAVNLTAGTYTVTASGITFGVNSGSAVVTARTATSIDVISNYITIEDNKTITFAVKDQYGVDMEIKGNVVTATAFDRTSGVAPNTTGALTLVGSATKSELAFSNIKTADKTKNNDEILVTVTYQGVTTNKVIVARDIAALASLELGEVTPVEGSTRITVNDTLVMPYDAIDQFGEEAKLTQVNTTVGQTARDLDGWFFTSSNNAVVDINSFAVDANGKMTFTAAAEGTTIITAVNSETGAVTQSTVKVYDLARLDTFVISTPNAIVVAGEKVTVPYEAYDQYGEPILPKNLNTANVTLTSSDDTKAKLEFLGKELRVNALATTAEVTLTATVPANTNPVTNNSKITIEVLAAATPAKITGVKNISTVLTNGSVSLLKANNLTVLDQYNRPYTLKGTEGAIAYYKSSSPAVTLKNKTGVSNTSTTLATGVPVTADSTTDYAQLTGTATAGTAVFVIQLVPDTSSPVAITGGSYELSVQNQSSVGIVGYEIKPIGQLNAAVGNDKDTNALGITVVGKDAANNDVALPAGTITTLTVSSSNFGVDLASMKVWSTVKGTATLTAWIGSNAVATTTLTSVEEAPVPTTISFAKSSYLLTGDVDDIDTTVSAGLTVVDQFGNTIAPPVAGTWVSSDLTVATISNASGHEGEITLKAPGSTSITFISTNGISASTTVEVGID